MKYKYNLDTQKYLLCAWSASDDTIWQFRKKLHEIALRRGIKTALGKLNITYANDSESSSTNIINCFETIKRLFTPEYLYIKNHMIKERNATNGIVINLKEERKIAKNVCKFRIEIKRSMG